MQIGRFGSKAGLAVRNIGETQSHCGIEPYLSATLLQIAPRKEKNRMLTAYPALPPAEALHAARAVLWFDLLDPTTEEKASVESKLGRELPSREELSEVESSSHISEERGVLFLSMPIVSRAGAMEEAPSPIGFVLSKDVLVTILFTQLRSFDKEAARFSKNDRARASKRSPRSWTRLWI
jgi:Mg2+ and Co2+ transporter CorA